MGILSRKKFVQKNVVQENHGFWNYFDNNIKRYIKLLYPGRLYTIQDTLGNCTNTDWEPKQ